MFGIILAAIGSLGDEISFSLGKWAVQHKEQGSYTFGLISWLGALLCFGILVLVGAADWRFSVASLPFLIPRICLELLQAQISTKILATASRSTLSFFLLLSVPMLLVIDTILGYSISTYQLIGIGIVLATAGILLMRQALDRADLPLILVSGVNATISISLYKYSISHFNSVAAEQTIVIAFLVVFFAVAVVAKERKLFLKQLNHPLFLVELVSRGASVGFLSFAYVFAAPSVISTAKKASGMIWGTLSGRAFFHEHHLHAKIIGIVVMTVGIVLIGG